LQDRAITLEELSGRYNVSRERIRQIEVRAFEKLQNRMRELAEDKGMLLDA
jgi:RNA polymerase sigma-32 factor